MKITITFNFDLETLKAHGINGKTEAMSIAVHEFRKVFNALDFPQSEVLRWTHRFDIISARELGNVKLGSVVVKS